MTTALLVPHGTITKEGSLDVAPLNLDLLEMEGTVAYHEGMVGKSREDKLNGQAVYHSSQVTIAKKLAELARADFPEILDVKAIDPRRGREFTRGQIRALPNRERGILTPKFRFYASFSVHGYTGTGRKTVPLTGLESYMRAKDIPELFDSFEIWERAKDERDARKRVGERRIPKPLPVIEFDPYLVGVVRFERTVNHRPAGYSHGMPRVEKIEIAPPRFFLIDRWDEVDPMP